MRAGSTERLLAPTGARSRIGLNRRVRTVGITAITSACVRYGYRARARVKVPISRASDQHKAGCPVSALPCVSMVIPQQPEDTHGATSFEGAFVHVLTVLSFQLSKGLHEHVLFTHDRHVHGRQ